MNLHYILNKYSNLTDNGFKPGPRTLTNDGVERARVWLVESCEPYEKVGHGKYAKDLAALAGTSVGELIAASIALKIPLSKDELIGVRFKKHTISIEDQTEMVYESIKHINAGSYYFVEVIEKHIRRCLYKSHAVSKKFYRFDRKLVNQAYISFDISNWWCSSSDPDFYYKVGGPQVFNFIPYESWSDDSEVRSRFTDEKLRDYNLAQYPKKPNSLSNGDKAKIRELLDKSVQHWQQASEILVFKHKHVNKAKKVIVKAISKVKELSNSLYEEK